MRSQVAYILGQIGPAAAPATDALAKLIDDKNPRVANEAVLALAKIGPRRQRRRARLIKAIQQPEDQDSNFDSIAYALGRSDRGRCGPARAVGFAQEFRRRPGAGQRLGPDPHRRRIGGDRREGRAGIGDQPWRARRR